MSSRAPFTFQRQVQAGAANASATQALIVCEYQDPAGGTQTGVLSEVSILPSATSAANGTNYRTWTLFNRGAAGTGTTSMATVDTTATAMTDNDERLMTLSTTSANLVVTPDDVLELVETVAGTGVAHSGYVAVVSIARG